MHTHVSALRRVRLAATTWAEPVSITGPVRCWEKGRPVVAYCMPTTCLLHAALVECVDEVEGFVAVTGVCKGKDMGGRAAVGVAKGESSKGAAILGRTLLTCWWVCNL